MSSTVIAQVVRRLPEAEGRVHSLAADLCLHPVAEGAIGPLAGAHGMLVEEHTIFSSGGLPCRVLLVREAASTEPLALLLVYPGSEGGPAVQTIVFRYSGSNDLVYGTRAPEPEAIELKRPEPAATLHQLADAISHDPHALRRGSDDALVVEEEPLVNARGALVRLVLVRARDSHEPVGVMLGQPAGPRPTIQHLSVFAYAGVHSQAPIDWVGDVHDGRDRAGAAGGARAAD